MTEKKKFIIGSRGSKLSLAYSGHVKNLLIKSSTQFDDSSIEIKIIKTSGDIFQNKRISEIGGKGVFCKQIEEELLDSKIDLAVHSLKDLPTQMTEGLCVNAVVKRNDPRDAFLSYSYKSFRELKPQSKIGTSSFRRHAQINLLRNGEIIETLDVYNLLIEGKYNLKKRLRSGDVIFVEARKNVVSIDGAVKRPAKYELKDGEFLDSVIKFSNGIKHTADLQNVSLERLLDGTLTVSYTHLTLPTNREV